MKRLIHDVPRWHLYLHRDARGLNPASPEDVALRRLEDELFDRLFSGECELLPPEQHDAKYGTWAELVVGAVVVVSAFVVAVAIVQAIDAYELRQREEAIRKKPTPDPVVKPAPEPEPDPSPKPQPSPVGPDGSIVVDVGRFRNGFARPVCVQPWLSLC